MVHTYFKCSVVLVCLQLAHGFNADGWIAQLRTNSHQLEQQQQHSQTAPETPQSPMAHQAVGAGGAALRPFPLFAAEAEEANTEAAKLWVEGTHD